MISSAAAAIRSYSLALGVFIWLGVTAVAQETLSPEGDSDGGDDLAKQSQNPVSDLISVPFQNNTNFRQGPYNQTGNILNIQPVVPIEINEEWNVISRTIIPIVHQVRLSPGIGPDLGLGDINPTLFLSPSKPAPFLSGNMVTGFGPTFLFPTSTGPTLGPGRWASGISGVAAYLDGPWVIGLLASNLWSFAPPYSHDNVRLLNAQYFINYNMKGGWYLTSSPIISADWTATPGKQWTVPVGGGLGRVFTIGKQPVNVSLSAYYNAVRPDNAAAWQIRFALALLFPTK
jgi:hypothetical protein